MSDDVYDRVKPISGNVKNEEWLQADDLTVARSSMQSENNIDDLLFVWINV